METSNEFLNSHEAKKRVFEHFGREFAKLEMVFPRQIVDGAVIGFVDREADRVVATGRLRFRNTILVCTESGDMQVRVNITDLTFANP